MVLVAGVHFAKPVAIRDEIWDLWKRSDRAMEFLSEPSVPAELPGQIFEDELFPRASRCTAFRVPLCGLPDPGALLERIVLPGLKLLM
jgi:hypothetical protein